jgi:Uma2 family endonuclease
MATGTQSTGSAPELRDGDRMTQREFHAIYGLMPKHVRAQLIAGRVYVASPMKVNHGRSTPPMAALLTLYEARTPGVEAMEGSTVILSEEDEPEPDLMLRILPEYGGKSRNTSDGYVEGPPELLIEVSDTTRLLDLGDKRRQYAIHGVREYLVVDLRDRRLHWFDLTADQELDAPADGVYRIKIFPGLWIDSAALFDRDLPRLLATLDAGLAAPEHAAFVASLAAVRRPE